MKKELVLALSVVTLTAGAIGFLLGRRFPAHHYEAWQTSKLFYDTATGKVCDPFGLVKGQAGQGTSTNESVPQTATSKDGAGTDPWDEALERVRKEYAKSHVPACD
jgi:hypothetical protein